MLRAKAETDVDFRHRLGINLRRLRKGAGLSQEDLMMLAGVHRTQISKYERGETEPQAEVLARLSRALGVSAEEFFSGIGWRDDPPRLIVEIPDKEGTVIAGRTHSSAQCCLTALPAPSSLLALDLGRWLRYLGLETGSLK